MAELWFKVMALAFLRQVVCRIALLTEAEVTHVEFWENETALACGAAGESPSLPRSEQRAT